MNRACYSKNTIKLAKSTQSNLHGQKQHASCIQPLKNNFIRMKRYSIILLISLFTALHAAAQLYPVRTITNVGAPYPLSLEQYGSFDNNRLQLTIIPNDIALQNYPVKLRLVISGGWFKIYTNPSFIHKEILLNNGETMTFTGADLAEWFNPDNLIFEGYSKAQYMKTGRLPEGVYQIWFEAWDLYRDFNISGTTKAMVFTLENEPPILNFPENKKELEPYDPQNIVFNWSFRQSPFSAGGSSHQYRFELWEIDPDDMNAEEAVRVMRPIYTTEVSATTLNYTAAEPLLFKGKRYAWRIQVFDPMGTMRYKNDGYSQVFWFRFGKDIPVPVLSLDKTTTSSITVKWENDYRITKYELRYRNKAKEGANWYTKDATGQSATIDNLEQNTPYEIQLHGYNGSQEGDYSESVTAKTNQDKAFACGTAPGAANTENTDPLSMLKSGDIFRASDFDIEVYKTSGANGNFTGRGFAMIPYLKFVKFEVEFNGIQINKDYRMTRGQVRFIYNENNGLDVSVRDIIDALKSDYPKVVEENPYTKTADKKITSDAEITEVTVDANGVVTAKTSDGRTTQVRGSTSGDMVAVSGGSDDSEQYVADTKSGTVYKGTPEKTTSGKKPEQPASKTSGPTQYEVTFLPHILQQGGMDIPTNNSPAANYHQIQVGSKTIQVPWKSVESNKIDRIIAHIAGDPADTVRFLTKEGNLVMTAPGDKAFVSQSAQNTPSSGTFKQLLVTGREKEDHLKAWYPEYEQVNDTTKKQNRILAGQVNIAAYDKITLDVCIVEVNGATVPETLPIEKELNEIYASSVVQWKVSRIKDFKVNIEGMQNGIFDNTDPNNDMDYTDHEKQVKEALKDHKDYHRKTLYLFFIGGKTKDNMLKGYMPFNKQFGFIFRDNQQIQELIRTIAHELGHGAFRLRHPFSTKCPYPQTKGQTNNLMDYVDAGKALQAIALHKYQWDEVHDFDLGLNWFEDEGEGMSNADDLNRLLRILKYSGTNSFAFGIKCSQLTKVTDGIIFTIRGETYHVFFMKYSYVGNELQINAFDFNENSIPTDLKIEGVSIPLELDKFILLNQTNAESKLVSHICTDLKENYSKICETGSLQSVPDLYQKLGNDIVNCFNALQLTPGGLTLTEISSILQNLKSQARSNQQFEFTQNGQIYRLNEQNEAEALENPESDADINAGNWNDASIDMKMRVGFNADGILQFAALGIRKDLPIASGKTAGLTQISANMLAKNNALLKEYQIKDIKATPKSTGVNLDSDAFADGKKVEIDNDASFIKILCEAGGIGLSFLKTAQVEQPVYLEDNQSTIKAPPIATGTVESVGMIVTDITSAVNMVYDIVTDKQARSQAKEGFVQIGKQIKDDPSKLFPILLDVVLEEFTGSTADNYEEMTSDATNKGRKHHLTTKTTVKTTVSLFTSGKILSELPEMSLEVAKKMAKEQFFKKFDELDDISDDVLDQFRKKLKTLPDGGEKILDDFKDLTDGESLKKLVNNPDLIDNWKMLDDEGIDASIRKNLDALADPNATINALQKVNKSKPTWPELQALWKRGNDFNKKGRIKYGDRQSEIVLQGVNGKAGKRVDAYIPGEKIISRKATDIDNITEQTWRNYCNELVTKYKVGTPINSTKLPGEPPLKGKYCLEIPATNQSAKNLNNFKAIAKEFGKDNGGIEIIFLTE